MPKLLQINSCLGILSTGKITESVAELAMQKVGNAIFYMVLEVLDDKTKTLPSIFFVRGVYAFC